MRSPASATIQTHFCANCDASPSTPNIAAPSGSSHPTPQAATAAEISSNSNSSGLSRSSTPLTEISETPSSPVFAPILDAAELLRRRRQSDTASAEIGKRMLKGWAMLADECPNSNCYGVPLVRPPKTGATVNPRKASSKRVRMEYSLIPHITGMRDLRYRLR